MCEASATTFKNDPMGEHGADCYCCREFIPEGNTQWGFTWGSDGCFPDGASAMYACWECRDMWIEWMHEAAEQGRDISHEDEPEAA
ncbi:hypothetical protein [Roseibium sp. Sym1]|uniref:hypothetical protein n=1 Tax=Roseibium sp. Sym1 TaxID=3016006 RepID=UPI0022B3EF3B|nr:hypothetical protein [Roseibium sp. Sym1]